MNLQFRAWSLRLQKVAGRRSLLLCLLGLALILVPGLTLAAQSAPKQSPAVQEMQSSGLEGVRGLIAQEKFQEADTQLREILKATPDSAEGRSLLGFVLFRENKPQLSLNEYTSAAKLRRPTADDLKIVALDYVLLNDYADADRWMTFSLSWKPTDAEAWYDLGRIKYSLNRFQESVKAFETSLQLSPRSVKAKNNLGLALEGLNRNDEAIAAYREAMAWQENSAHPSEQPLLNLGIILVNRGEMEEARTLLLKAEQIAPKDHKIHEQLGHLYLKKQDLPEAKDELEMAVALAPESGALHFQLGQVYKRLGLSEKARTEFARVSELNGSHSSPDNNAPSPQ